MVSNTFILYTIKFLELGVLLYNPCMQYKHTIRNIDVHLIAHLVESQIVNHDRPDDTTFLQHLVVIVLNMMCGMGLTMFADSSYHRTVWLHVAYMAWHHELFGAHDEKRAGDVLKWIIPLWIIHCFLVLMMYDNI